MSLKTDLAVLREPNFGWFFWSRFINIAGSSMSSVALAFAVLEVTDSASALGQVLAAHSIPMVVFLLVGGVVADRFPRALLLQLSNVLSALTQGVAAYLVISGHAEIWMLVVLEGVNGTTSAVSMPAMQGLIPQLVRKDQLQPANVLLSMSRSGLTIAGPSVAAVLVVTVGAGWGLAADALTWAVAAALLLPVRIPPRTVEPGPRTSMLHELRVGWTFFRTTTWLWVVVLAFCFLNAIQVGAMQVLAPPFVKHEIGVGAWGAANSAQSVGLLLMTFVLLRVTFRFPLRAGMLGIAFFAVPLLVLALAPHAVPLVVAMAVAGAGTEVFSLGWNLAMMENVPGDMLSRAFSYDMLGSFVALPLGQLVYGPLGQWFGTTEVFLVSGVAYVVLCLATVAVPAVARLQRVEQPAAEGAPA